VVVPGVFFTLIAIYPAIEAWVTKDRGQHNICDRPRNKPGRTAFGAMMIAYFAIMLLAGGNDLIAVHFHISLYATTWIFRVAFIVLPPIVFWVTRRVCLGLQRRDLHSAHHGYETGRIVMLPNGEFIEVEAALPPQQIARMGLEYRQRSAPQLPPAVDQHGVRSPASNSPIEKVRGALGGFIYEPEVGIEPTHLDEESEHDAQERHEITSGLGD
jgi:ubiquinol-cytochrome c reductase cytochrome b subunit